MQLQNSFEVPTSADETFATLLDLERVAPCMPGAELDGSEGDEFHGRLKLRIGPITVAYEGTVTVEQADEARREARLRAAGRELGGQGTANATVVASVRELGTDRSEVQVVTDLEIRGKAAQFGRGALGEVTQRVLDQFARNLEATLGAQEPAEVTEGAPATSPVGSPVPGSTVVPADAGLDVLSMVWKPFATRVVPVVAALVVGYWFGRVIGGRRSAAPAAPGSVWAGPAWSAVPPPVCAGHGVTEAGSPTGWPPGGQ